MTIVARPSDAFGCGTWRIGIPARAVQKLEPTLEVLIYEQLPVKTIPRLSGPPEPISFDFETLGLDVEAIVYQRPISDRELAMLKAAKRQGIRVVIEIDDDFHALQANTPAWAAYHPKRNKSENQHWLGEACKIADLVTCTTPALARRYAPHGRVVVLPNYVPEAWLDIDADRDGNVVGWPGNAATHRYDLQVTHGGVAEAVNETGARFRVIGVSKFITEHLGIEDFEFVDWVEFSEYPHEVGKLDVGIAPLADSTFNRAKSWLKPLEFAALGVPCVMSPVAEYVRVHELGVGVLAKDRSRDWRREVAKLLRDDRWADEVVKRSEDAARELTIEKHAWRWAEAWAGARVRG